MIILEGLNTDVFPNLLLKQLDPLGKAFVLPIIKVVFDYFLKNTKVWFSSLASILMRLFDFETVIAVLLQYLLCPSFSKAELICSILDWQFGLKMLIRSIFFVLALNQSFPHDESWLRLTKLLLNFSWINFWDDSFFDWLYFAIQVIKRVSQQESAMTFRRKLWQLNMTALEF